MKRRVLKLCLFLLLGAIINVAVAWGFVWFADLSSATPVQFGMRGRTTSATSAYRVWENLGRTRVYFPGALPFHAALPPSKVPDEMPWWGDRDISAYRSEGSPGQSYPKPPMREASGWPCRACWSEYIYRGGDWKKGPHGGIELKTYSQGPNISTIENVLPIFPIWLGFAINTTLYAAILWLLFALPGTVRRRMRVHRGRCVACGYDLRGIRGRGRTAGARVCPECGRSAGASTS